MYDYGVMWSKRVDETERVCGNCLFWDEDMYGVHSTCSFDGRWLSGGHKCDDCDKFENINVAMDTVYRNGTFSKREIIDLKRQVVLMERRLKEVEK